MKRQLFGDTECVPPCSTKGRSDRLEKKLTYRWELRKCVLKRDLSNSGGMDFRIFSIFCHLVVLFKYFFYFFFQCTWFDFLMWWRVYDEGVITPHPHTQHNTLLHLHSKLLLTCLHWCFLINIEINMWVYGYNKLT